MPVMPVTILAIPALVEAKQSKYLNGVINNNLSFSIANLHWAAEGWSQSMAGVG